MSRSRAFSPVRIGVIGLGRFGRLHALTLAGLAEAELVGAVGRDMHGLPGGPGELVRPVRDIAGRADVVLLPANVFLGGHAQPAAAAAGGQHCRVPLPVAPDRGRTAQERFSETGCR